jgi:hypothetical protein
VSEIAWFGGWVLAIVVVYAAALRLLGWCWSARGRLMRAIRLTLVGAFIIVVSVFANIALIRHDRQLDLTSTHRYTPNAQALAAIDALERPVSLTYFYRGDDPAGVRAQRIVEDLGRRNPLLEVVTSDPDTDPTLAQTSGVKLYNAALLEADGRRIVVQGTDEREIALGVQRIIGLNTLRVCFMTGHDEYPSDNETFHTHVEALGGGSHDHDHGARAVVETTAHGIGRLRRSLEALGHGVRDVSPAVDGKIDRECRVLIDAGPRTAYSEIEVAALREYLANGGSALLMYDLGFPVSPSHAALLERFGIRPEPAIIVDDVQHYAGDAEMVAAMSYPPHPVTKNLSFAFFPGARPLVLGTPAAGIEHSAIVTSSANARVQALADVSAHAHDAGADHDHGPAPSAAPPRRSAVLAAAVTGRITHDAAPFRLVLIGDSDFASNSFYPYMSNSRLALSIVRWLSGEESNTAIDARIDVRESIELSRTQQRGVFVLLVLLLPGLIALLGGAMWWVRR